MSTVQKALSRTNPKQQQLTFIAVIVVVAIAAAALFIILSNNEGVSRGVDYSTLPQSRTPDGGFVLGDPNAPVTLVEFADFFCPVCQGYKSTVDRFIEEYVATGQAKFEYRFLPTRASQSSTFAAQIAECVAEEDESRFWEAYDVMFNYASGAGQDDRIGQHVADRLGMDYADLLDCASSATQYQTDQRLANQLEITGTPGIRVRYGDSQPQLIAPQFTTGEVPFSQLEAIILAAQVGQ
ncbi:MAG: thioredoxin domain-containing protein [bacterium]|nr:thioredoxin domain-containing protein [bacterium]